MSFDPWTALAVTKKQTDGTELMKNLGLHVMKAEWAQAGIGTGRVFSTTTTKTTLKVHGTEEEMTIPVQTCTTVYDVKCMLADRLMIPVDQLNFIHRQGCAWRVHKDIDEISRKVTVKGIQSFRPLPFAWPHPVAIMGAGYNGIKAGMRWIKDGNANFVVFDRNERAGGNCWLKHANKHSRLQTEFAPFHVWFGPEFGADTRCGGTPTAGTCHIWPDREQVLEHLQRAAEEYGLLPHCQFQVEITGIEVQGRKTDMTRLYDLALAPPGEQADRVFRGVGLLSFPGVMCTTRRLEIVGEATFEGGICYGTNDDIPYERIAKSRTAVIGCGAFAVENVRTCLDYGATMVHQIVRRRNLACPRLACWFVHQAALPVPGRLLLRQFEPMYMIADIGDPFGYYSVRGTRDTENVTISQDSRFGISDVLFLAHAYGKLEIIVDEVKRVTKSSLFLAKGSKLLVHNIIKCLGLTGDPQVDKLHRTKHMVGFWMDGDYRRPLHIDPPGMHAANFETLSTGMGSYLNTNIHKFFFDYPKEYHHAADMGLLDMLPVTKAEEDKPCYCYNATYSALSRTLLQSMCPKIASLGTGVTRYKHDVMHSAHPLKQYLQACIEEWDKYQEDWRAQDEDQDYIPYPYGESLVDAWLADHKKAMGGRTVDDSLVPRMTAQETAKYHDSSYDWWTSFSQEASCAWASRKTKMKSTRASSVG